MLTTRVLSQMCHRAPVQTARNPLILLGLRDFALSQRCHRRGGKRLIFERLSQCSGVQNGVRLLPRRRAKTSPQSRLWRLRCLRSAYEHSDPEASPDQHSRQWLGASSRGSAPAARRSCRYGERHANPVSSHKNAKLKHDLPILCFRRQKESPASLGDIPLHPVSRRTSTRRTGQMPVSCTPSASRAPPRMDFPHIRQENAAVWRKHQ